uniref:Jacalin-type lectin domain-containing protein n=1 Tax=Esox lucius TaxID=8010 RepID=A0AAY5KKL9_ESOLU
MATLLYLIGGQGGGSFELTGRDNGATLKKIGVAVEGWQIKAVRAELTDGRVKTFGEANTFSEFEFSLGERITKLSLWGNGAGTRLGGIRIWTSKGREFFQHMNSWPLKTEYSIDVGSGVCLGLQGRCGADIDSMGFLFISPIRTSVLTDMRYPNLAMFTPQTVQYSRTVTKSSSWTTTNKIESTINISVKAGIPDLVEVSGGWSLTVGQQQSSSMSNQETITEADTATVKIPPGKTVSVEMSVGRAVIDLAYSAVVKVTCLNGSELVFPSTGNYNGVNYTSVNIRTTESDKVMNVN